jgi:hypothetical protein
MINDVELNKHKYNMGSLYIIAIPAFNQFNVVGTPLCNVRLEMRLKEINDKALRIKIL